MHNTLNEDLQGFSYYLTTHDLEQILPYCRAYLQQLFVRGTLPGRKLGGRWVITRPELADWINENSRTAQGLEP